MTNAKALEVLREMRNEKRSKHIEPDYVLLMDAKARGVDDDNILELGRTGHVTKVRMINCEGLIIR